MEVVHELHITIFLFMEDIVIPGIMARAAIPLGQGGRFGLHSCYIAAGGERLAHAGNNDAAHIVIGIGCPQGLVHIVVHRVRTVGQGIQALRAIDRDLSTGPN